LPLKILAAAAVLRVVMQLAYPVMFGSGRPQMAVRLSATTLLLLSTGMLLVGLTVPVARGIVAMSAVWLVVPPLLLLWQARYLRRFCNVGAQELIRALGAPFVAVAILVATVEVGRVLIGSGGSPALELGMILTLAVLACVGLLLHDPRRVYRAAHPAGDHATMHE
jgi:hypothetical protein